jgi:hypothetical protein
MLASILHMDTWRVATFLWILTLVATTVPVSGDVDMVNRSHLLPLCPDYPTLIVNGTLDKNGMPLPMDSCVPGRPSSAAQTDSSLTSWTNRIDWWGSDFDESLSCFALWMLVYGITYSRSHTTYARIITGKYFLQSDPHGTTQSVQDEVGAPPPIPPLQLALGILEHRRRLSATMVSLVHSVIVSVMGVWVLTSTPILWTEPMVGVTSAGRFVTVITCSYFEFDAVLELLALLDVHQLPYARDIAAAKLEHAVFLIHHAVGILACRLVLFMNQGLFFLLGMILMDIATPFMNVLSVLRWYKTNRHLVAVWGAIVFVVFVVVRPINQIAQVVWLVIIYTNRPGYVHVYWVVAWGLFMGLFMFLNLNWTYRFNASRQGVLVDFAMDHLSISPNAIGQEHPDSVVHVQRSRSDQYLSDSVPQSSIGGDDVEMQLVKSGATPYSNNAPTVRELRNTRPKKRRTNKLYTFPLSHKGYDTLVETDVMDDESPTSVEAQHLTPSQLHKHTLASTSGTSGTSGHRNGDVVRTSSSVEPHSDTAIKHTADAAEDPDDNSYV